MKFKFANNKTVESLDKVPEVFRSFYEEGADGKYKLIEAHAAAADAVDGLTGSLKKARDEATETKKKIVDISALADYGESPEDIKAAFDAKVQELQDEIAKGGEAKLNLDKVREEMTKANQKEIEKINAKTDAYRNQLEKVLVENEALTAISEHKGRKLLLPFVSEKVRMVEEDGEFKVYVVDKQNERRVGATGEDMTIKELVAEMKGDKEYAPLFESEAPSGGGTRPGSTQRAPVPREQRSSVQKIAGGLQKGQYNHGVGSGQQ